MSTPDAEHPFRSGPELPPKVRSPRDRDGSLLCVLTALWNLCGTPYVGIATRSEAWLLGSAWSVVAVAWFAHAWSRPSHRRRVAIISAITVGLAVAESWLVYSLHHATGDLGPYF